MHKEPLRKFDRSLEVQAEFQLYGPPSRLPSTCR